MAKKNDENASPTTNVAVLADNLTLPAAGLATQRTAFVGASGSGKSYGVGRIVEQLSAAGVPVIVLDTVGIWASLRIAADGTGPGLPFVVLGGDHADVPLSFDKGAEVATFLHGRRASAVLDLSDASVDERSLFVAAFCDRLLALLKRKRSPMTVVFDEAPDLVPEKVRKGQNEMALSVSGFVRKVRNYSCGTILVTQRPQDVAKAPFDQAGTVFVGSLFGKHERQAMRDWIGRKARSEVVEEQYGRLPTLEPGQFFFWSPAWKRYEEIRILPKWTWDGSSTNPIADDAVLQRLAPVDVGALKELLGGMRAERSGAEKKERSQVSGISSGTEPGASSAEPLVEEDGTLPWRQWVGRLRAELAIETARAESAVQRLGDVEGHLDRLSEMLSPVMVHLPRRPPKWAPSKTTQEDIERLAVDKTPGLSSKKRLVPSPTPTPAAPLSVPLRQRVERQLQQGRVVTVDSHEVADEQEAEVKPTRVSEAPQLRVLAALAHDDGRMEKVRLAIVCGYQHSGGGFQAVMAALRAEGFIYGERGEPMLTPKGRARAKGLPAPMRGEALRSYWLGKLKGAARKIFALLLLERRPMTLQEIADGAVDASGKGYAVNGGGFHDGMRDLRRYALVESRRGKAIELGVAKEDFLGE